MKKFKKRFVIPVSLFAGVIIGGTVVYAMAPLDFAPKASSWVKAECTQKLLDKRKGELNNQKATICYNYIKNSAQDGRIASLQSSVDSSTPGNTPMLVDGNGKVLGPSMASGAEFGQYHFYDKQLKRIVSIDRGGRVNRGVAVSFTSNDCTGTPYSIDYVGNSLLNVGQGRGSQRVYYIVDNSDVEPVQVTLNSQLIPQVGGSLTCGSEPNFPRTGLASKLTPISIGFTDPVATPVHFQ